MMGASAIQWKLGNPSMSVLNSWSCGAGRSRSAINLSGGARREILGCRAVEYLSWGDDSIIELESSTLKLFRCIRRRMLETALGFPFSPVRSWGPSILMWMQRSSSVSWIGGPCEVLGVWWIWVAGRVSKFDSEE